MDLISYLIDSVLVWFPVPYAGGCGGWWIGYSCSGPRSPSCVFGTLALLR